MLKWPSNLVSWHEVTGKFAYTLPVTNTYVKKTTNIFFFFCFLEDSNSQEIWDFEVLLCSCSLTLQLQNSSAFCQLWMCVYLLKRIIPFFHLLRYFSFDCNTDIWHYITDDFSTLQHWFQNGTVLWYHLDQRWIILTAQIFPPLFCWLYPATQIKVRLVILSLFLTGNWFTMFFGTMLFVSLNALL